MIFHTRVEPLPACRKRLPGFIRNSLKGLLFVGSLLIGTLPAPAQVRYENLVMEGGGIRGIAYAGALQALEEGGVVSGIKRVAGTSVGGLVAALFAVGYTAPELQAILQELNIRQFNDGQWIFIGGQQRFRQQFGWYRGDRLEAWVGRLIAAKTGSTQLTFAQLDSLAATGSSFRQLHLAATDLSAQRAVMFNAANTPGMEVKVAVRASMSIPLYFTAVLLDSGGVRHKRVKSCPECHVFIDGGVLANYPLSLFDDTERGKPLANPKTLGLKLERVAQLDSMQTTGAIAPFRINSLSRYVGALYNLCIEGLNRRGDFADERFRTVYISTGDLNPRVRKISDTQKQLLYRNGYDATKAFLKAGAPGNR